MKKLPSFYATPRPPLTDYQIYVIGGFGKFESFVVTLENKFKKDKVRISARQSWTAQLQGVFFKTGIHFKNAFFSRSNFLL